MSDRSDLAKLLDRLGVEYEMSRTEFSQGIIETAVSVCGAEGVFEVTFNDAGQFTGYGVWQ